ncbi:hypothetical protein LBMAG56_44470 [Verrucomicrobiota bacterium]|nr:hypothetical protein LBMAG56_44470 [Verrucomicrobiota bacterium]
MKSQPKPGSAVAEPLWVIAAGLFVIAGILGYNGYRDLQRRAEEPVAPPRATPPAVAGRAVKLPATISPPTNDTAAATNIAKPTQPAGRTNRTTSPVRSDAVSLGAPAGTNAATNVISVPKARSDEPPLARIEHGHLILPGEIRGRSEFPIRGLTGVVRLRGTPPPEKLLPIDPTCSAILDRKIPHTRFYLVGADAGLADVFVYIRSGLKALRWAPPYQPLLINQVGCDFQPYIAGAQTGQTIRVRNSDPILHNVHATPVVGSNQEFNVAQPHRSADAIFGWQVPELFLRLKCDVHPWMFAYVSVLDHPFFGVTDANGNLRMLAPPPGRYEIEAIHRKAGSAVQTIDVEAGKDVAVQFTLDARP